MTYANIASPGRPARGPPGPVRGSQGLRWAAGVAARLAEASKMCKLYTRSPLAGARRASPPAAGCAASAFGGSEDGRASLYGDGLVRLRVDGSAADRRPPRPPPRPRRHAQLPLVQRRSSHARRAGRPPPAKPAKKAAKPAAGRRPSKRPRRRRRSPAKKSAKKRGQEERQEVGEEGAPRRPRRRAPGRPPSARRKKAGRRAAQEGAGESAR